MLDSSVSHLNPGKIKAPFLARLEARIIGIKWLYLVDFKLRTGIISGDENQRLPPEYTYQL
jgi:hypothetical protein